MIPIPDQTIYRNLGRVDKYGIDGSVSLSSDPRSHGLCLRVVPEVGNQEQRPDRRVHGVVHPGSSCTAVGQPIYALTAGKRESGAPIYTFGGRVCRAMSARSIWACRQSGPVRAIPERPEPAEPCVHRQPGQPGLPDRPRRSPIRSIRQRPRPTRRSISMPACRWVGPASTTRPILQINVQNLFNEYYVGGFTGGLQDPAQ